MRKENTSSINCEELIIASKQNDRDCLLDELGNNKIISGLESIDIKICEKNSTPRTQVYFLYNIRRFGTFSYLLTQAPDINYSNSFSKKVLFNKINTWDGNKIKEKKFILKSEELIYIINYALTISEVHELLRDIKYERLKDIDKNKFKTDNDKLFTILDWFNTFKFEILEKQAGNTEIFKKIIKVALLSIPQIRASEQYSSFAKSDLFTLGNTKVEICNKLLEAFAEGKLENVLADKILLLVTLIEGVLWNTGDNSELRDFCSGNLHNVLMNNVGNIINDEKIKEEIIYNIETHSFYLNQFEFYIYGRLNNFSDNEDELSRKLSKVFISNLSDIILFAKSVISRSNNDSIHTWAELSNPIVPQSIANGIVSVALPIKIGIFIIDDKTNKENIELNAIENTVFIREYTVISSLEMLNNPWALYTTNGIFNPKYEEFIEIGKKDVITNRDKKQVAIKISNFNEESRFIILEFDNFQKFSYQNFFNEFSEDKFSYYKYTFKAFVEKLQYIHRSASLNLNPSAWYKKAFCSLYKDFDKVRFNKQYIKKFRDWELKKFEDIIGNNENIVIYNIGASYGRLEKFLMHDNLSNNIKTIYAIDQNQEYLDGIKEYVYKDEKGKVNNSLKEKANQKIITKRFDFRNIELIDKNEKADIVCFMHTTFGYFNDDEENKSVLLKACNLLKPKGVLIIDQFNPGTTPIHCNKVTVPAYEFTCNNRNYKGIKTSNHKTLTDTNKNYGLYFGNYMYFDIKDGDEKLIKCDTYNIKLYKKEWFTTALVDEKYEPKVDFVDEVEVGRGKKKIKEHQTMLITITKLEENTGLKCNDSEDKPALDKEQTKKTNTLPI